MPLIVNLQRCPPWGTLGIFSLTCAPLTCDTTSQRYVTTRSAAQQPAGRYSYIVVVHSILRYRVMLGRGTMEPMCIWYANSKTKWLFHWKKIDKIREDLYQEKLMSYIHVHIPKPAPAVFSSFVPLSDSDTQKLIISRPTKHCDLDPIPTWLLNQCSGILLPL